MNKNKIVIILFLLAGIVSFSKQAQAANCGGVTPCNCGDTVVEDYTLTGDMTCTDDCLIVGADSIIIDGNNHTITGDGDDGDYGIDNSDGWDNITIQNFGNITNFGRGIYCSDASGGTIQNNTTNSNTYGIYLDYSPGTVNQDWYSVASDSDGSNLIAAAYNGWLYTSSDSGGTWTGRQPAGDANKYWNSADSDSDGSNLIAGVRDGRLYTSSDSGASWAERQPAGDADKVWQSAASDSDGSNLIAAAYNGRLYTSSDSGVSWTERQPAGDADKFWRSVASDSDGSNLIAAVYIGRLYTSSDSGVSWIERQPAGDANKLWYSAASDSDGSNLIAGVRNGRLYTSSDSGVSWTERQPAGNVNKYWYSAASDSDGSNLIASVSNGRLYTSSDSGASWAERQPAGDANKLWRSVASDSDGSNLIAGLSDGRLYTSSDSGASWTEHTVIDVTSNTLTSNTANSNTESGIYLYRSDSNILTNNTANSNSGSSLNEGINAVYSRGIHLRFSSNNYLGLDNTPGTGNTANSNSNTGIYFYQSVNNHLNYNTTDLNGIWGIIAYGSNNNTFTGNTTNSNGYYGIQIDGSIEGTVSGNTSNSNGKDGIYLYGSWYITIENNTVQDNLYTGMRIRENGSSNTITGNIVKSNVYGIYLADNSSNTITNNIINSNTSDGIHLDSSTSNTITNNTFYNALSQFALTQISNSTGTSFKNNIVYSGKYVSVGGGSQTSSEYDYNDYYGGSGDYFNWRGGNYSTFADWKTASGQDSNSLNSDPLFTDATGGDFSLKSDSFCIDAGTDVDTPNTDYKGLDRYDYPFIANSGGGTNDYYDIGAYEYVGINSGITNTVGSDRSIVYSTYPTTTATAVALAVIPSTGTVDVIINTWGMSGYYYKEWTETASFPGITAEHKVGDLAPNGYYVVKKDSIWIDSCISDNLGQITFTCLAGSVFTVEGADIGSQTDDDDYHCFLTTLFATAMADEDRVLCKFREFRDEYLLTNTIGKVFVKTYYKISPSIAYLIREHPVLKKAVGSVLNPLIWMSEKSIELQSLN